MLVILPGALISQKFYHVFFSSFYFVFSALYNENFRYFGVFRTVEIVKREKLRYAFI